MAAAQHRPKAGLLRALLAAAVAGGLTTALARVAARLTGELSAVGARGLEGGVAVLAVGLGTIALGIVTAGCLLTAVGAAARLGGRTLTRLEAAASRLTPGLLRRAIAVGIGTGLLASWGGVATAAEQDPWGAGADASSGASAGTDPVAAGPDLGWQITWTPGPSDAGVETPTPATPSDLPSVDDDAAPDDRDGAQLPESMPGEGDAPAIPSAAAPSAAAPSAAAPSAAPITVTVRLGDSLWSIAAAHLADGSGNAAIAAAWPRWYAANRAAIGDDPDLIRPGQVLTAPVEELS